MVETLIFIIIIVPILVIYLIQDRYYSQFWNDMKLHYPEAYEKMYKRFFVEWLYFRFITPGVYTNIIHEYKLSGESLEIAKKGRFWSRILLMSSLVLVILGIFVGFIINAIDVLKDF